MCVGVSAQLRPQIQKGQIAKFNLRSGRSEEIWFLEDGMGRRAVILRYRDTQSS